MVDFNCDLLSLFQSCYNKELYTSVQSLFIKSGDQQTNKSSKKKKITNTDWCNFHP